jgi:2'-5' RNA ligase
LAQNILEWSDHHVPDSMLYTNPDDPTFGREEEPHITVLYGLHSSDHRPVEKVLHNERTGEVVLGRMSLFTSNDKFDVLKIEVESEMLHKLHKTLSNNLPATDAYPSYIPHVTIAYVKKGKADKFVGEEVFKGETFSPAELIFSSKTGTRTKIKIGAK